MIDERKYRYRTSDTEEDIDHIDDDLRNSRHIDITSPEVFRCKSEDIFCAGIVV